MNRRRFLTNIAASFFVLPSATTYARKWMAQKDSDFHFDTDSNLWTLSGTIVIQRSLEMFKHYSPCFEPLEFKEQSILYLPHDTESRIVVDYRTET